MEKLTYHRNEPLELKEDYGRKCYLVFNGDIIVGRIDIILRSFYKENKYDVFISVSKKLRNKGYGKMIYSQLPPAIAPEELYAIVKTDNQASINLHTSMGFKLVDSMQYEDEKFFVFRVR
jgi:L-amino acid N-acyltransferase YncA